MEAVSLASILGDITTIGTSAIGWMTSITGWITSQPLVFTMVCSFFFIGGAIGLVRRLIG